MSESLAGPVQGGRLPGSGIGFEMRAHNCFACGQLNAHGLRLALHFEHRRCWTELVIPERFEGWEGLAHGGILSTILDEVMAWALVEQDSWGVTARMTVDFRRPVAVGTAIRAEGEITDARRRLFRTQGRIVDLGTGALLVTAEGVYVAAPEERKRQLKERYGFRLLGPEPGAVADPGDLRRGRRPEARPDPRPEVAG